MPPPPGARRSQKSPFASLENIEDFDKQITVFTVYGAIHDELILPNGDVVIKGDCVEIKQGEDYSATSVSGENWFAEVLEIRGEDKHARNDQLYLKCQWFYSEINLNKFRPTVGNLSTCSFGKNELVISNHEQIIAADCILRKVVVRFFDEEDRTQRPIGRKEKWYRFMFQTGKGVADNRLVLNKYKTLPPARCAVEACRKRYNPDEDFQRFCSRDGCELWFHNQCLENVRFEKSDQRHYRHRLRAMLAGLREFQDVPDDFFSWFEESVREGMVHFPKYAIGSILNIIWCAQLPIARGNKYGIVGNEEKVGKARTLLKQIWDYRDADSWPTDEEAAEFASYTRPKQRVFGCQRCGMAI